MADRSTDDDHKSIHKMTLPLCSSLYLCLFTGQNNVCFVFLHLHLSVLVYRWNTLFLLHSYVNSSFKYSTLPPIVFVHSLLLLLSIRFSLLSCGLIIKTVHPMLTERRKILTKTESATVGGRNYDAMFNGQVPVCLARCTSFSRGCHESALQQTKE